MFQLFLGTHWTYSDIRSEKLTVWYFVKKLPQEFPEIASEISTKISGKMHPDIDPKFLWKKNFSEFQQDVQRFIQRLLKKSLSDFLQKKYIFFLKFLRIFFCHYLSNSLNNAADDVFRVSVRIIWASFTGNPIVTLTYTI